MLASHEAIDLQYRLKPGQEINTKHLDARALLIVPAVKFALQRQRIIFSEC